jgi:hypothetical protein
VIDTRTGRQVDQLVERLLRDAGCQPPVRLDNILQYLEVDLHYYDLEDAGLIRRFIHRAKVKGQYLADQIARIVRKVKLHALWCPDDDQIFVDQSLPDLKKKWAGFHDATHRLLPWHREFFRWDTAQTLDPAFQEMLEAEANYGGSALMFCGQRFTNEALDTVPSWASVKMLSTRHRASLTTTLRRYVQHSHAKPMAAVISTPRWLSLSEGQTARVRHLDLSPTFVRELGGVSPAAFGAIVDANTVFASGGPIGNFHCTLLDMRGEERLFRGESFFNRHDALTLFVEQRPITGTKIGLAGCSVKAGIKLPATRPVL